VTVSVPIFLRRFDERAEVDVGDLRVQCADGELLLGTRERMFKLYSRNAFARLILLMSPSGTPSRYNSIDFGVTGQVESDCG
jgi:hypothetical protein